MRRLNMVACGLAFITVAGLAIAGGAKAQSPDLSKEGWKHLLGASPAQESHARQAWKAASVIPFRIDLGSILVTDADGSGSVTAGDLFVANGAIATTSGAVVGDWQSAGTFTSTDTVATFQFHFNGAGTIVTSGATAYSDGVKSGVPSRAIVGGTGRYVGVGGNAGIASNGTSLFIGFGVK